MFGHYSMLISILIFAGAALTIEWLIKKQILAKNLRTIFFIVTLSLLFTVLGLEWMEPKKWDYGVETTFRQTLFGSEIELYLLAALSYGAISQAVIILSSYEDEGKPLFSSLRRNFNKFSHPVKSS